MTSLDHFLDQILASVLDGAKALAVAFLVFTVLERFFRLSRGRKPLAATMLDLKYAVLSMLYPPCIYALLAVVFGAGALQPRSSPPAGPLAFTGQLFAVLFVRDCLIYARHRIFHLRPVWPFHSIHHSSEEVNWLSALRFHPAENIIETIAEILLFTGSALIGVDPRALFVAGITMGFYNLLVHSNLRLTFGPLRYVLVSPVFHRWHHSDAPAARDKNFAAMFSCIDLALGSFYLPKDELPVTVGLPAPERSSHPRTLHGQLAYPFVK